MTRKSLRQFLFILQGLAAGRTAGEVLFGGGVFRGRKTSVHVLMQLVLEKLAIHRFCISSVP
jgi:hypothetical protein